MSITILTLQIYSSQSEGRRHYLVGNTSAFVDQLRSAGAHWDGDRKAWWTSERDVAERFAAGTAGRGARKEIKMEAKKLIFLAEESNLGVEGEYEFSGYELPDGRVWVEGAGVDGKDSLYASRESVEPNGLAHIVEITETDDTREITVEDLACGDADNLTFGGQSLLTPEERVALDAAVGQSDCSCPR